MDTVQLPSSVLDYLLRLPNTYVHDVDDAGRLLVGYDGSGTAQLHELEVAGNWRRLTDLGEAASGRYLPDRRAVVVEHATGGSERSQLFLLELSEVADLSADPPGDATSDVASDHGVLHAEVPPLRPLVYDERWIHRLVDTQTGALLYLTNRRNGVDFDLVRRNLDTGGETVLYDGGGLVSEVAAAPNGHWVALTRPSGVAHAYQLLMVATADSSVTELTGWEEPAWIRALSWLPDSSGLICSANVDREVLAVVVVDPVTGAAEDLVADERHDLTASCSPAGEHLLVTRNVNGGSEVRLHRVGDGTPVVRLDLPEPCYTGGTAPAWSPDGRFVALSVSSPIAPSTAVRVDVRTAGAAAPSAQPPTAATSAPVTTVSTPQPDPAYVELRLPEMHRVATADGEQIPVDLYRPCRPDPTGSVVIELHGGPESQAFRRWAPVRQALLADGHAVVVPDVRGSTGYGKRWYTLDDRRRRLNAVGDLAALHDWLGTVGLAPSRAALYGGSYGGYLVLAGLSMQPERWAAGVDVVGMASLVTFLENTAAYRRSAREREYGFLERDRAFLHEASPLTHIERIRAPLLCIHGANDPRVPLSETEQMAAALRERGRECELRVYPDEGHGLAKLANKWDAYPAMLRFLDRHLAGEVASPWEAPHDPPPTTGRREPADDNPRRKVRIPDE